MPNKKPVSNKPKSTTKIEQKPQEPEIKQEEPKEEQKFFETYQEPKYFKLYQVGFAHYNYFVAADSMSEAEDKLREQEASMRPLPIKATELIVEGYKILCEKVE